MKYIIILGILFSNLFSVMNEHEELLLEALNTSTCENINKLYDNMIVDYYIYKAKAEAIEEVNPDEKVSTLENKTHSYYVERAENRATIISLIRKKIEKHKCKESSDIFMRVLILDKDTMEDTYRNFLKKEK